MKSFEKEISLRCRVFSWDNILDLLTILEEQSQKYPDSRFSICFLCDDGFKIRYDHICEIDEKKFLSNYKVVGITAKSSIPNLDIYLTINTEDSYCSSYITVESSDEMLFHFLINKFNEIIKNIKKQKFVFVQKRPLLTYFCICGCYIVSLYISRLFLSYKPPLTIITLIYILPPLFFTKVVDFLHKAYPIVEMEFIPENKNIAKKYRKWTSCIWGSCILPLVLSGVYEGIRFLFLHR